MTRHTHKVYSTSSEVETYLDMEAAVGITKHIGGYRATDALHRLCHVDEAKEVLEVGCGIGVGPAYIARRYGCRVTATDLSERMLDWARQRAEQAGVMERMRFQQADVLALPFEDNSFDVVLAESVLAFVTDKAAAIREMMRVTRPGGYVGVNEVYWLEAMETPYENPQLGTDIITGDQWRTLWQQTGLEEQVIEPMKLSYTREGLDRIQWIGWGALLRGWGSFIRLWFKQPSLRAHMKALFSSPGPIMHNLGFGLYIGRKP